jgi:deazaflavin-dependent oxidoreductase (nitroreductase family)
MTSTAPTFNRGRPSRWRRLMFKAPVALYRDGPAEILRRRCVMLLTTKGRKSGLPRTGGVSFMPLDDHFVVFSGWGIRSDWYQNLLADPEVTLQSGRRRIPALAVPVADPERRRQLMRQMRERSAHCGPPRPVRELLRRTGVFDYDGELELAVAQAGSLPVVELIPQADHQGRIPHH